MSTTTTERLHAMSDALKGMRVVDVKFYFNKGRLSVMAPSEVASNVADFLDSFVRGEGKKVSSIGDAAARS